MIILSDREFFLFALMLYGLGAIYSIFLAHDGFRRDSRVHYLLLASGFMFHTTAMFLRGVSQGRCPVHNLYEMTSFIGWALALIYLVIGTWSRLRFLGAFVSPLLFAMCVFAVMPGLDDPASNPGFALPGWDQAATKAQLSGGWLSLHVALFALAYGAFGLSSVAGLMYLFQEHNLKFHKLRAVLSLLPPIQRLELLTGRLLAVGFGLLSAGLLVSLGWFYHRFQTLLLGDIKFVWSILVWVIYFGLVLMRWKFSHRGRRFAWGAIASFVFVLLTFWGTSWWSPSHRP